MKNQPQERTSSDKKKSSDSKSNDKKTKDDYPRRRRGDASTRGRHRRILNE